MGSSVGFLFGSHPSTSSGRADSGRILKRDVFDERVKLCLYHERMGQPARPELVEGFEQGLPRALSLLFHHIIDPLQRQSVR